MREVELKFSVHGAFAVPHFADQTGVATSVELSPQDLRATYFDTKELRLARNGITLRHRSGEGPGPRWTLKIPVKATPVLEREEVTFPAPTRTVPDEIKNLVLAFTRGTALGPVATLRTRRRRWLLKNARAEALAELVDDEVDVLENRRVVSRFREIEIEQMGATPEQLDRIGQALREGGASDSEPIPKVVRALGARAGAPTDLIEVTDLDPTNPARRIVEASVTSAARRLIQHDPIARIGADPEGVHQMRVAARRLRSDLKTFKDLVKKEWSAPLRSELKWLGDMLGPVRDLDVLQQRLHASSEDLEPAIKPLFEVLAERHEKARQRMLGALGSKRYLKLLAMLEIPGAEVFTKEASKPCKKLPSIVATRWARARKQARRLRPTDGDEKFHRLRISCKRARYAAEAIAPALGQQNRDAMRFAKALSKVQDVLGANQDANVARETILDVTSQRPDDTGFHTALGQLIERQNRVAIEARARFSRAWEKVDRNKNLRWLKTRHR